MLVFSGIGEIRGFLHRQKGFDLYSSNVYGSKKKTVGDHRFGSFFLLPIGFSGTQIYVQTLASSMLWRFLDCTDSWLKFFREGVLDTPPHPPCLKTFSALVVRCFLANPRY